MLQPAHPTQPCLPPTPHPTHTPTGASQASLADETSGKVATDMVQLNTLGPIRLTQAALPAMLQRGKGRLVVVASAAAKVPSPGQAVYSASKAALWGYFSSLATEVADR